MQRQHPRTSKEKLPPIQQINKKNKKQKRNQDKRQQQKIDQMIEDKALKYMSGDSLKVAVVKGRKQIVETDRLFVDSIKAICHSRQTVMFDLNADKGNQLTEQECDQIHYRAKLHRRANQININTGLTKNDLKEKQALKSLYCRCGCGRFKGSSYPICQKMTELSFLGSGILLFFLLIKGLVFNTLFMFLAYCLYAVITYAGGQTYKTSNPGSCVTAFCQFKNRFSSYNQTNPNTTFMVLDWIGLGVMILWILNTRLVKYYGFYQNKMIDKSIKSASDFAVKVDNLPVGSYSQYELFQFFEQQYQSKIRDMKPHQITMDIYDFGNNLAQTQNNTKVMPSKEVSNLSEQGLSNKKQISAIIEPKVQSSTIKDEDQEENHFKIRSIQIIYKMEFSRKIIAKIIQNSFWINRLIKQSEGQIIIRDKDQYLTRKKQIIEIYETLEDLRKKFLNDCSFRQKIATHSAIVYFEQEEDMKKVQKHLGHENLTLYKKIKQNLNSCIWGSSSAMFKGQIPDIIRAPEPSDIHWQNCEKEFSYMRIFGIYFVTFVVIMVSLGIIAGVQAIQFRIVQDSGSSPSTLATILNIVASVVLTIVNAVLWIVLKHLLTYQYNHTITNKITSLMGKASFATWINIIIIPIVVNYIIYGKYYGSQGVAGMVVDYQVAALAASLPLILFNPMQIAVNIAIKVRCIRNFFIKLKYRKKRGHIDGKLDKEQLKKVYQFYDPPEFVIEQAYVFILPNIMQALFFCQLQPVLLIFAFVQTFLFYWVCKIKVLKITKIPVLIDRLVFQVAVYHVMLAPIFYGVGSIYNSYVSSRLNPNINFSFLGAAICVGLGLLNYFNPGNIFQKIVDCIAECFPCLKKENVYQNLKERGEEKQKEQEKNSKSLNLRVQNYYRNSNSLDLLGFEKTILGQTKGEQIEKQLQSFCESHVGASIRLNKDEESFRLSEEDKDFERLQSKHVANIFE